MIKILFVCHGNICRSTMSQSVFQHMVDQAGLSDEFYIDSAATSSAIRRITARSANSVRQEFRVSTTGPARCGRMNTISLITLSGWIHGISAISIGSSGTVILTAKSVNFWILRTGEERISRTPGTQGILTRHTEM